MDFNDLIPAVAAAILYGVSGYFKRQFPNLSVNNFNLEDFLKAFSLLKLGATVALSIGIGVVLTVLGVPVTQASFSQQMVNYIAYLVPIENVIKAIYRYCKKQTNLPP